MLFRSKNNGRALWDPKISNNLFVNIYRDGESRVISLSFSELLRSFEAEAMIAKIMIQKNIPSELKAEVRKRMENVVSDFSLRRTG